MFQFSIAAKNNRARTGIFSTPHGDLLTPVFAPGTFIYGATVSNPNATVTFAPVAANANALIEVRVNGGPFSTVASGSASGPVTSHLTS